MSRLRIVDAATLERVLFALGFQKSGTACMSPALLLELFDDASALRCTRAESMG